MDHLEAFGQHAVHLVFDGVAAAHVGDPHLAAGLADAFDSTFTLLQAGGGELGFGKPQICVEVKSGSDPVDRPTVDKLIGAGQKFGAETCLFVSWGGFRPNVQKELARDFFRVRLWSRKDLLEKLFIHYDRLPEEIRLALPLKRVWMVADQNLA